jgi:hypothetical protein
MTILATKINPDLLFYVNNYVVNSVSNKYSIPFPDTFSSLFLDSNKSFIRLLFDESWPTTLTNYRYLFRLESVEAAPETVRRRMMIYPGNTYYICDSDSTSVCNINIFGLEQDDLDMLDKLLQYRIDSTSCDITTIVYLNLTTNLSKLIYIYLKFKLNTDYSLFDNDSIISNSDNVLENFYESFIIDTIFIYLSSCGT